jgi:hypothetical protein
MVSCLQVGSTEANSHLQSLARQPTSKNNGDPKRMVGCAFDKTDPFVANRKKTHETKGAGTKEGVEEQDVLERNQATGAQNNMRNLNPIIFERMN